MEYPPEALRRVTKAWVSGMSPEAADFASAERAAGDPPVVAPEPEVEDPDPEDPQPAMSATTAQTTTDSETMDRCIGAEDAAGP
jgi:hypothetical protein